MAVRVRAVAGGPSGGATISADAGGHRVEHPRLVQVVESLGDFGQCVLIERQQRAHVDVVRARDFRGFDHVVRQETHGHSAAGRQLRVGNQIDGHKIGE